MTMAGKLLALNTRALLSKACTPFQAAAMSSEARKLIGKREIVGYGYNGEPTYIDRVDYPLPAIRWREPTSDIQALREKEKGDWNKLSLEEKKALYRASFCQTYSEFKAPSGGWKSVTGLTFLIMSGSFWVYYFYKFCVYPPLPASFAEDKRSAQLRRIIDLQVNPIEGLASKWDYEKNDWKK